MMTSRLGGLLVAAIAVVLGVGCAGTLTASGGADVVYDAPPPPRHVVIGSAPYAGAIWVDGHWAWNGSDWQWQDGYWTQQRAGYVYVQPRWERRGGGWYLERGRWDSRQSVRVAPQPQYRQRVRPQYRQDVRVRPAEPMRRGHGGRRH